jgi:hypothetical protein
VAACSQKRARNARRRSYAEPLVSWSVPNAAQQRGPPGSHPRVWGSLAVWSPPICCGLASAICRVECREEVWAERRRRSKPPPCAQRAPALLVTKKAWSTSHPTPARPRSRLRMLSSPSLIESRDVSRGRGSARRKVSWGKPQRGFFERIKAARSASTASGDGGPRGTFRRALPLPRRQLLSKVRSDRTGLRCQSRVRSRSPNAADKHQGAKAQRSPTPPPARGPRKQTSRCESESIRRISTLAPYASLL